MHVASHELRSANYLFFSAFPRIFLQISGGRRANSPIIVNCESTVARVVEISDWTCYGAIDCYNGDNNLQSTKNSLTSTVSFPVARFIDTYYNLMNP